MHDRQSLPSVMAENVISEATMEVDGRTFSWFLLRRAGRLVEESPPNFVGQLRLGSGERVFVIADEVPEQYRHFLLKQEMIEFEILGGQVDRCQNSIKRVLAEVPGEIRGSYLEFLRKFYRFMVPYTVEHGYDPELIGELRKGLDFLESAV